jgi:hypothetical protein
MKKKYINPMIQLVRLHAERPMLTNSHYGPVNSVNNSEGFVMDNNGLDSDDDLR